MGDLMANIGSTNSIVFMKTLETDTFNSNVMAFRNENFKITAFSWNHEVGRYIQWYHYQLLHGKKKQEGCHYSTSQRGFTRILAPLYLLSGIHLSEM